MALYELSGLNDLEGKTAALEVAVSGENSYESQILDLVAFRPLLGSNKGQRTIGSKVVGFTT